VRYGSRTYLLMSAPNAQRFFAPEVVQTAEMDCGPATLKCLLEGFGIEVNYGRLREACQTDVDGTSIDTLEAVARQLGLQAEQMILPVDHLLLPVAEALPALAVTLLPNGAPHFIVVWRRHGDWVQIMDPAGGRRWLTSARFLPQLYRHSLPVAAADWRAWAGEAGFQAPLRARLSHLGVTAPTIERWLQAAAADPFWLALATLDAATRLCTALYQAGALSRGASVERLLTRLLAQSRAAAPGALTTIIPAPFWSVQPLLVSQEQQQAGEQQLVMRGAVIVRVTGKQPADPPEPTTAATPPPVPLSPELTAVLTEAPARPEWELWRALRADGLVTPAAVGIALGIAAAGVTLEALLLRGLLAVGAQVGWADQRLNLLLFVLLFALGLLLLELPIAAMTMQMGRQVETRLRMALLEKIPRLGDRYFHSRLLSDMTNRAHGLRSLRTLPDLGARFLRTAFQLMLTAAGVIWLAPTTALPALLITVLALAVVLLTQPLINEQSATVRTHAGALSRFYLDALLGLIPLRTHSAAAALRREHESLLVEWVRVTLRFFHTTIFIQAAQALLSMSFAIWIVWHYLSTGGAADGVLLLLYWTLNLPVLAQSLAELTQQYPDQRNRLLRLLEPLGAPEEETGDRRQETRRQKTEDKKTRR